MSMLSSCSWDSLLRIITSVTDTLDIWLSTSTKLHLAVVLNGNVWKLLKSIRAFCAGNDDAGNGNKITQVCCSMYSTIACIVQTTATECCFRTHQSSSKIIHDENEEKVDSAAAIEKITEEAWLAPLLLQRIQHEEQRQESFCSDKCSRLAAARTIVSFASKAWGRSFLFRYSHMSKRGKGVHQGEKQCERRQAGRRNRQCHHFVCSTLLTALRGDNCGTLASANDLRVRTKARQALSLLLPTAVAEGDSDRWTLLGPCLETVLVRLITSEIKDESITETNVSLGMTNTVGSGIVRDVVSGNSTIES